MNEHTRTIDAYRVKIKVDTAIGGYHCRVYRRRKKAWEGLVVLPTYRTALIGLDDEGSISDAAVDAVFATRGF